MNKINVFYVYDLWVPNTTCCTSLASLVHHNVRRQTDRHSDGVGLGARDGDNNDNELLTRETLLFANGPNSMSPFYERKCCNSTSI